MLKTKEKSLPIILVRCLITSLMLFTYSISFSAPCETKNVTICGVLECECKWDHNNQTCSSVNKKNCCIYDSVQKCKNNIDTACYDGGCGGWCGSSKRNTPRTCEAPVNPIITPQQKKYIINKDITNDVSGRINNKKGNINQKISDKKDKIKEAIYN